MLWDAAHVNPLRQDPVALSVRSISCRDGTIVWTLVANGQELGVPQRMTGIFLQLETDRAMGGMTQAPDEQVGSPQGLSG